MTINTIKKLIAIIVKYKLNNLTFYDDIFISQSYTHNYNNKAFAQLKFLTNNTITNLKIEYISLIKDKTSKIDRTSKIISSLKLNVFLYKNEILEFKKPFNY